MDEQLAKRIRTQNRLATLTTIEAWLIAVPLIAFVVVFGGLALWLLVF